MEQETEATQDYYILFRDTGYIPNVSRSLVLQKIDLPISSENKKKSSIDETMGMVSTCCIGCGTLQIPPTSTPARPTRTPVPIDYAKRCEEMDLLLADKAAYVWGYVGKLTAEQAISVKNSLNSDVDKGLWLEYMSSVESTDDNDEIQFVHHPRGVIKVMPQKREALEFLASASPNLVFFRHVSLDKNVRIYPESAQEKQQIIEKLKPKSTQKSFGYKFHYLADRVEPTKRHRSFVELLSLEMLKEIWQRFGYSQHMDLLRRTAGIWVVDILEDDTKRIKRVADGLPDVIKTTFQSILDSSDYIQTLTPRQKTILGSCVGIVNKIREKSGHKGSEFENKYLEKNTSKARRREKAKRWAKKVKARKAKKEKYVTVDDYYLQEMRDRKQKLSAKLDTPASAPEPVPVKSEKNTARNILQPQASEGQSEPSVPINTVPTAPKEEPNRLPDEQQEPVDKQEDVLDLLEKKEGRWVSQKVFLDRKINANRGNFTERELLGNREKNNIEWSEKNSAIGMDKGGNFLERSGKNRWNYKYRYFLLKEFDLQSPSHVPNETSHVPKGN